MIRLPLPGRALPGRPLPTRAPARASAPARAPAALLVLLLGAPAPAAVLYVDDDNVAGPWDGTPAAPFASIQQGIDAAAPGDVVRVLPGTYLERIAFGGKAIRVESAQGPDATTIDGGRLGSVVTFAGTEPREAVLAGFTITGGLAQNGGGIHCASAAPTIAGNRIRDNVVSGSGGGIFSFQGGPLVVGNVVEDNVGPWSGGGLNLTECTSVVVGNVFTGNVAGKRGGGVRVRDGSVAVVGNVILGNEAPYGGGLTCTSSLVVNNLIAGNLATEYGGGVYWTNGQPTIVGNTVTGNAAVLGGGGLCCGYNGTTSVASTIVWDNAAPQGAQLWVGSSAVTSTLEVRYSLVEGGQAAAFVQPGCALAWGAGNLALDPLFADPDGPDDDPATLGDNDYRLAAGSPGIDAGDGDALPADLADLDCDADTTEPTPLDLDGLLRAVDDPETPDTGAGDAPPVDVGAYEHGSVAPPPPAWSDVGDGLAGTYGVPVLAGSGALCGGGAIALTLAGALEDTTATLVIGLSAVSQPFKGGILVPAPDLLVPGLATGAGGGFVLGATWPDAPAGITLLVQCWIQDSAGPVGLSASNAVTATSG